MGDMILRTMKYLLTAVLLSASVKGGKVMESSDEWIPMKENHKIHAREANGHGAYAHSSVPQDTTVDLHNKEFCVDVSTYQPVVWVEREGEECSTVFVKDCADRSENICQDVTETKCEVQPYKECKMGLEPQQ